MEKAKENINRKSFKKLFGSEFVTIYTYQGFLVGLIFPVLAWLMGFIFLNYSFTFIGFKSLHLKFPLFFIFEIFPFFLAVLAYIYASRTEKEVSSLKKKLELEEKTIQRNVELAKMIGDRHLTFNEDYIEKDDNLGAALIKMHHNLVENSKKEEELNWIARGKDLISSILRQHNVIDTLSYETLVHLIEYIGAIQGAFYLYSEDEKKMINISTYAFNRKKFIRQEFAVGQGLIGQCAYELDIIYRKEIPDDYISISSGILGDKKPKTILIVPLLSDEKLQGIIEFASLQEEISDLIIKFVRELSEIIGQTIFNLKVNTRTEKLLRDAQTMTQELKENEEALRKNAIQMKITQEELEKSNKSLEAKIKEVENAQKRLHSLLENASEIISIFDENEQVTYISPSVKHILGYMPEDIVNKNLFEEIFNLATDKLKLAFTQLIENPENHQIVEFQYKKPQGETLWLETTGRNLITNPAINGIIFNTRDITVRKVAERAQRMSGQMQALSENSPDMILRIGPTGKFFYVNPVVEQYTGVITYDIINKTLSEVRINPEITNLFGRLLEHVRETLTKYETETTFPTISGERIMLVNAIPEFNEERELESILYVAHDITDRKQIERELIEKNKAINDSINYAQRIQSAILPDNKVVREYLPNSFIFYKPKELVSGDFPWFFEKGDDIYIAVVDCTGHSVPGAMLSFIGYFLLNSIVDKDRVHTTGEILDALHFGVRKSLKQDRADAQARDGMDIALCKINMKKRELQYSGAHRPLYYLKNGKIKQYKGDAKAIGGIPDSKIEEKEFVTHTVNFDIGDKVFFFSDGLPDQIGGSKGRKYQASRIRQIIEENPDVSMVEYSRYFTRDFNQWKGDHKQIDDVLLIGVEF